MMTNTFTCPRSNYCVPPLFIVQQTNTHLTIIYDELRKGLCKMLKNNDCWLFVKILSLFLLLSLLSTCTKQIYYAWWEDLSLLEERENKTKMFVYFIFILYIQKVNLRRKAVWRWKQKKNKKKENCRTHTKKLFIMMNGDNDVENNVRWPLLKTMLAFPHHYHLYHECTIVCLFSWEQFLFFNF